MAKRQIDLFRILLLSARKPARISFSTHKHLHSVSSNTERLIRSPNTPQIKQQYKPTSTLNVLQRYGFPTSDLHNFLSKNPFLRDTKPFDLENSFKILLAMRPSRQFLISLVSNCPAVLELVFLKKWELGLSELGVSNPTDLMTQNVIQISRKFCLSPDNVSKSLKRLKSLGLSDRTLVRVLEESPMVIVMRENKICEIIHFLTKMNLHGAEIDWILNIFPGILLFSVENKLQPLFNEFHELGFCLDAVKNEILMEPRVLGFELGEFSKCLEFLKSLNCRIPIKEKIFSKGTFRAGVEVKQRVDCLCSRGLTYRDAFNVLWKEPRAIVYSVKDVDRKIDFLVQTMKFDVQCLVDVPEYLGVNFEKQIVPRYKVIEYLRFRGGLGDDVGLKRLIGLTRLKFYNFYVKPYPECEKIYGRFTVDVVSKNKHPVGLWKLLRPKQFPKTNEDLKNIKSFMHAIA
ncbi:transcription termination factor MTERF15, mitochondrial [Impatiens glandulifera]|uniref:transcription termination factor MTERF15, mitochondrial n=1 Tax=Impatiens glandulifera TaxID=253017 RepID=UPI001FB06089|nr:transcription termination factor MTERF15, mitochondrial [Impatiens glandulifera]